MRQPAFLFVLTGFLAIIAGVGSCSQSPVDSAKTLIPSAPGSDSGRSPVPRRVVADGPRDIRLQRLVDAVSGHLEPSRIGGMAVAEIAASSLKAGGSTTYVVSALVDRKDGHYGAVSVEVDDPVGTVGDPACAPSMQPCETRRIPGGVLTILDHVHPPAEQGLLMGVFYSDNGGAQSLRVKSALTVTKQNSYFWDGGYPLVQVPLDKEGLVSLAEFVRGQS